MVEGGQLQEAQAISVLHEMLQQSFNLFHTERASAAWDTTLLEQLRTGLHQQLDNLDACLGQVMGEEDSALGRTGPTLALKRYFQGIHVYLKEKGYSDCAWETVRVEIMRSFSSLISLQERRVLMLLRQLKRVSPSSCLQDRNDFAFPQEALGGSQLQKAQAISVLHEVIQHTFQLFSTEGSAAAWDQSLLDKLPTALDQQLTDLQACLRQEEGLRGAPLLKEDSSLASFNLFHIERSSAAWDTALLEQLRTGLHQQLDDLDACLGQVMGEEDSALGRTGPTLAVKRYFQGTHVYLQEKGYSDCTWEILRVEMMKALSSSTSLQERKGRVNAGAGAEIKGSERSRGKAAVGSRTRKGNFLGSGGPTRSLSPGGASPGAEAPADWDSRVLRVDPALEFPALNLEAGPPGWAALSVRYGEFGCALPAAGAQPKEPWAHLNRSSACHFSVVR
ncbi:hypothetical protein R6Z07M_002577 [Ovis aries]